MGGRGSAYGATTMATTATPSGKTLADVQAMDDQQLHDFLLEVDKTDMPDFLNTHHLQKMVYALNLNDKPEIVSQQEFDDATTNAPFGSGQPVLYRTVNDTTLAGGIHLTATDMCDMLATGDLTYHGNGIHGDGLYFSNDLQGSQAYGTGGGHSRTMAAYLNSKAKLITETNLRKQYDAFVKSHPQARKALGFARARSTHDSMSQFALISGYNVIVSPQGGHENYYTVLDRSVLTTTTNYKVY